MANNPVFIRVKASAEFGGRKIPITAFEITYALDDIPTAVIYVPMGRNVRSAETNDLTLDDLLSADPFTPIKISANFTVDGEEAAQPSLLFEGFLLGASANIIKTTTEGVAKIGVKAKGRIYPLMMLPRSIGTINTAAPGCSISPLNTCFAKGDNVGLSALSTALKSNLADFSDGDCDIWYAVKQLMENSTDETADAFTNRKIAIEGADAALEKFDDDETLVLPVPGEVDLDGKERLSAQMTLFFVSIWYDELLTAGGLDSPETFNGASIWDGLQTIMQAFSIHFVPTIESDYLLPITLGRSGEPFKAIKPSEYFDIYTESEEADTGLGTNLIDEVIITDPNLRAPDSWERNPTGVFAQAAYFTEEDEEGKEKPKASIGMPIVVPAPAWLTMRVPLGMEAKRALVGPIPDDMNSEEVDARAQEIQAKSTVDSNYGLGQLLAESYLYDLAFHSRTLRLAGKVRFDIAPGSLVSVDIPGDRFGAGISGTLYGHVESVMISVDGSKAVTALSLRCVRTEAEHDEFTTVSHPLFSEKDEDSGESIDDGLSGKPLMAGEEEEEE